MKRRALLTLPLVAAVAAAAPTAGVRTASDALQSMRRLDVLARLRGCTEGEFWLWIQGDVFGRAPEEILRPLIGFCSLLRMRYRRASDDAYLFEQRESAHFYDVATDTVSETFENPYTGVVNIPVGYVAPRFGFRLEAGGVFDAGNAFTFGEGMFTRDLETDGTDIWNTEIRANEYPTGLRREEFPDAFASEIRRSKDIATYRARIRDIADESLRVVPARVSFVADLPWLQWMLMGKRPGHIFWYGQGAKCASTDELPASLVRRVDAVHPGFLAKPWELDGKPYGTLYQMRRLRKAGKI